MLVLPVPHSLCGMTADYSPVGVPPVVMQMPFLFLDRLLNKERTKNSPVLCSAASYMVLLITSLRLNRTLKKTGLMCNFCQAMLAETRVQFRTRTIGKVTAFAGYPSLFANSWSAIKTTKDFIIG